MRAKDIMSREVVSVPSYLTLGELARVFEERCISGAPVVDEEGDVVGVVSQTDLVRARRDGAFGVAVFQRELDEPLAAAGMHVEDPDRTRVERIMTPGAISVPQETDVRELAELMVERRIHRVLVTAGDRLVGIVTSMDLVRALAPPAP